MERTNLETRITVSKSRGKLGRLAKGRETELFHSYSGTGTPEGGRRGEDCRRERGGGGGDGGGGGSRGVGNDKRGWQVGLCVEIFPTCCQTILMETKLWPLFPPDKYRARARARAPDHFPCDNVPPTRQRDTCRDCLRVNLERR